MPKKMRGDIAVLQSAGPDDSPSQRSIAVYDADTLQPIGSGWQDAPVSCIDSRLTVLPLAHLRAAFGDYDMHYLREELSFILDNEAETERIANPPTQSIVGRLEAGGDKVFSILRFSFEDLTTLPREFASWRTSALAIIKDSKIELAPFFALYRGPGVTTLVHVAGGKKEKLVPIRNMFL
jgi:hypothetical protein